MVKKKNENISEAIIVCNRRRQKNVIVYIASLKKKKGPLKNPGTLSTKRDRVGILELR